jgi:hypothetical protein
MAGFPIAWEDTPSIDQISDLCPYSTIEMENYLFGNHYQWVLNEEPTTFSVSGPRAQRLEAERRYWLFEAFDKANKQQWFIVVGAGKSPFDPSKKLKRWMYAETNDGNLLPDRFLDEASREQIVVDARNR